MEKTMSLFNIFFSAIKEWREKHQEAISDEKILSGEISDVEFAEIAKDLDPDIISQLQNSRKGKGIEKLDMGQDVKKGFVKKVSKSKTKSVSTNVDTLFLVKAKPYIFLITYCKSLKAAWAKRKR